VLWLDNGKIIDEGEPEEILKKFLKNMKPAIPMPERTSDKTVIKVNNLSRDTGLSGREKYSTLIISILNSNRVR